jgi:hypothetical protein
LRQFVHAACGNLSREIGSTLPMSRNGLLLLIVGLAVLVAVGILTS